jgi:hypothetical protein
VLKTPFIFTAADISHPTTAIKYNRRSGLRTVNRHVKTRVDDKQVPERSDNGKKCARNIRIRPQKTTSFAFK